MKKIILLLAIAFPLLIFAQVNADVAHNQAYDLAKKGQFQKGLDVLKKAASFAGNNPILLKDIAYFTYLTGDYGKAAELAKDLTQKNIDDEEAYQIWGSSLLMSKKYDESIDAYGQGITKYPKSAVLYAELGDAYNQNNESAQAIAIWEKGIKMDANISNNYYHLAKAYAKNANPLRAIINAEIFVNIENRTSRTIEMRNLLLEQYKTIFSNATYLSRYINTKSDFLQKVATTFKKYDMVVADGVNPESLSALRSQFIVDWFQQGFDKQYPFALFDRYRSMLKFGIFDAYNHWLFSAYNSSQFKSWANMNKGQMDEFMRYFNFSMLKFPEGSQHYM